MDVWLIIAISKLDVFSKRLECVLGGLIFRVQLLKSTLLSKPGRLKSVGEAWLSQAFTFSTSLFGEELWGSACSSSPFPASSLRASFPLNRSTGHIFPRGQGYFLHGVFQRSLLWALSLKARLIGIDLEISHCLLCPSPW